MSTNDAEQRCMMCRALGFVIAAIIVGLITWWLFSKVAAWLAILAFLGLFAFGLWAVLKFCGEPAVGHGHASASSSASAGAAVAGAGVAGAVAAGAASASTQDRAGSSANDAAAKAQADADAQAARAKAEADAAAAKAKADADAAAAKAKADADAAAAKADADARAAAAKSSAESDAEAARVKAELEAAKAKAQADAAKAKAEAEAAKAAAAAAPISKEKSVAHGVANVGASTSPGTKPKGLDGPRGGSADDLKKIKGVGPKMENMLNGMGYYHFDQVADWGDQEVAWVDDNLEGFKGRVTRDRWVPQARLLADGRQVSDDVLERIKAGEEVDLTDYDGDGISEGRAGEGSKPETLSGPRGGKADDLKQIKGVGPKLEGVVNSLGFYHFDQIASWSRDEIAWVDAQLKFKGRIDRDGWIEQAKLLAAGGETEFSKKVDKGGVY